ncbi:unnamed protein product [Parascedosporium putredinis]|uniref:Uncharacterized protein n=1 Tax=Parascedosporium putredinis TaxID=1442378 RepID=A0A9P1GVK5_9PEZI|nr:unnamed protein product [Parascedosporium putredinis]CAI7988131.1 unnamed protein product [Parascedosporium putredinis]
MGSIARGRGQATNGGFLRRPVDDAQREGRTPSSNLLKALTAFATHKASVGEVSAALPTFVSILKARRELSDSPPPPKVSSGGPSKSLLEMVGGVFQPPAYPEAPDDGTSAPWRDARELCEEAGLRLYIGEILYATRSKEEGVAWTREAVDAAEEQLRKVTEKKGSAVDKEAKKTCQQCLSTGLYNWSAMAAALANVESKRKADAKAQEPSRFRFWSRTGSEATADRWLAEEKVAQERIRQTKSLLEEVAPPPSNPLMAIFKV